MENLHVKKQKLFDFKVNNLIPLNLILTKLINNFINKSTTTDIPVYFLSMGYLGSNIMS